MNNKENNKTTGVGFAGLLTIAFIVLKLLGKISWSWIWVIAPIWISTLIYIIVSLIILLYIKG